MAYQPKGFFLLFAQLRGEGVNEIVWIIGGGVELCTETMSAVYTVPKPEVNCFVDI